MIRINDIAEIDGSAMRVVQRFGSLALLIPMKGQSFELLDCDADELDKAVESGEIALLKDPWADLPHREASEGMLKTAQERYALIKPIVSNPKLYEKGGRSRLVRAWSKGNAQQERQLSLLVAVYWRRGQTVRALMPDLGHAAGKRVQTGAKRGRKPRSEEANEGTALNPELLQAMNNASLQYLQSEGRMTLRDAYEWLCNDIKSHSKDSPSDEMAADSGKSSSSPSAGVPTYHQFYYYYRTRHGSLSGNGSGDK